MESHVNQYIRSKIECSWNLRLDIGKHRGELKFSIFKNSSRLFQPRLDSKYEIKLENYSNLKALQLKDVWLGRLTLYHVMSANFNSLYLSFRQNDSIENGTLSYLADKNYTEEIKIILHMQPKLDNSLGDKCFNEFDESLCDIPANSTELHGKLNTHTHTYIHAHTHTHSSSFSHVSWLRPV